MPLWFLAWEAAGLQEEQKGSQYKQSGCIFKAHGCSRSNEPLRLAPHPLQLTLLEVATRPGPGACCFLSPPPGSAAWCCPGILLWPLEVSVFSRGLQGDFWES